MKVKLLKKIRKRFIIEYYPNRDNVKKYKLTDNESGEYYVYGIRNEWHIDQQSALNDILELLRWQYQSRSRKYKIQNIKTKVWHNG